MFTLVAKLTEFGIVFEVETVPTPMEKKEGKEQNDGDSEIRA
jgi:hypothetical protein